MAIDRFPREEPMDRDSLLKDLKNLSVESVMIHKGLDMLLAEKNSPEEAIKNMLDRLTESNRDPQKNDAKNTAERYEKLLLRAKKVQQIKSAIFELPPPIQLVMAERYLEGKTTIQTMAAHNLSNSSYWRAHQTGLNTLFFILDDKSRGDPG